MDDTTTSAGPARAARPSDDTRWDVYRSPVRRRILVVSWVFVTIMTSLAFLAGNAIANAAAVILGVAAVSLLRLVVRSTVDLPDEHLDERLVATRNHVYRVAYPVLACVAIVPLLVVYIAWDAQRISYDPSPAHVNALFWLVLLTSLGLPSAFYAWTQKEI